MHLSLRSILVAASAVTRFAPAVEDRPTVQRRAVKLAAVASSATGLSLMTVPQNFEGLKSCVQALQSHFNGRRSEVEIESPSQGRLDRD